MYTANNLYMWSSCRGHLYLLSQNGVYQWEYEPKDEPRERIPNENVTGIPLRMLLGKVDDVCQKYFFSVQQREGQRFIKFFESMYKDDFVNSLNPIQRKALGSVGFVFNRLEAKEHIEFSKNAPSYRIVAQGLNLEAKCLNKVCEAYKKFVIIPKGIGEFNIPEEMDNAICPACDKLLKFTQVNNLGFWNCTYKIKGKMIQPEELPVDPPPDTAEKRNYTTFISEDNCQWAYLTVTTSLPIKEHAEPIESSGCRLI